MFQPTKNSRSIIKEAYELQALVDEMEDSEVLTYKRIEGVTGENYRTSHSQSVIGKARKLLLADTQKGGGYWLTNLARRGYMKSPAMVQLKESGAGVGRSFRAMKKAVKIAEAISDERLPMGQARTLRDLIVQRGQFLVAHTRVEHKAMLGMVKAVESTPVVYPPGHKEGEVE